MNIKVIFLDFDDTVLDYTKGVSIDIPSIEAIKKAQRKGVLVFLNTSRHHLCIKKSGILEVLKPDGIISNTGAIIEYNGEFIHLDYLDEETVQKMYDFCTARHYNLEIADEYDRYLITDDLTYVKTIFHDHTNMPPRTDVYKKKKATALLAFGEDVDAEEISRIIHDKYMTEQFTSHTVDCYHKNSSKGTGVKFILNKFGFSKDEAMAFGDSYSDMPMFKEVKYSICMSNGKSEAKDIAYYVTDTVSNSGVKKALEHFKII